MGINTVWKHEINGIKVGTFNCLGTEICVKDIVANWYQGPTNFNLFYVDFNGMFGDKVDNTVEPVKRIKLNSDDLTALAFESDEVLQTLHELIEVVNYSSRPIVSAERKKKYSHLLSKIADRITDYRHENGLLNSDLTIVPMKGGRYFLNYLDKSKIHNNTLAIECKRIQVTKKNSFCFGMAIAPSPDFPANSTFQSVLLSQKAKKIRIVELCIVSGMTTLGFLLYLKENNIVPEVVEINTIAISQQGYEVIKDFAKEQGIKVKFITGGIYYRLGNYYVSRRDELLTLDGKSVIGDVRSFLD